MQLYDLSRKKRDVKGHKLYISRLKFLRYTCIIEEDSTQESMQDYGGFYGKI